MKQTSTHEYIYNGNDGRKEGRKEILEHNASMLFIILFYLYYFIDTYVFIINMVKLLWKNEYTITHEKNGGNQE